MLGATAAVTDALAACGSWPTCDGRWFVPLDDPLAVALIHRGAALLVGLVLIGTVVIGWRVHTDRRTRTLFVAVLGLYAVQMLVGAIVASVGRGPLQSVVHLGLAAVIFGALVIALAWSLERRFPIDRPIQAASKRAEDTSEPSLPSGLRGHVLAYVSLTKPRLMWLLCLVALAGMALAAGSALSPGIVLATMLGGVLAIGAAGTFNHVLERDIDRRMARTADRPLVTDRVPVANAAIFGLALAILSVTVFAFFLNWVAAALGIAAIIFYSVIYTLVLKPNTVQNTVIGGLAGALPALIGWSAVTGRIGIPAVVLAAVIFCWTPAHFYNLAMAYREDYASGGFPMLPVVHGDSVARRHVVLYAGATMLAAAALLTVSHLDAIYAIGGILIAVGFLVAIVAFHREHTRGAALRTFHASNVYLGLFLALVVVDALFA